MYVIVVYRSPIDYTRLMAELLHTSCEIMRSKPITDAILNGWRTREKRGLLFLDRIFWHPRGSRMIKTPRKSTFRIIRHGDQMRVDTALVNSVHTLPPQTPAPLRRLSARPLESSAQWLSAGLNCQLPLLTLSMIQLFNR